MKNKKTFLILTLALVLVIPALTFSAPPGSPPTSNVSPTFSSVTLQGTGAYLAFPGSGNTMTGAYGKYVGTGTTSMGNMGGYAGAKAKCAAFTDSHVCSAQEITNSYEYGITLPGTGYLWINNGPPGYISDVSNDCNGWIDNNSTADTRGYSVYGSIWDFANDAPYITTCDAVIGVACCSN